MKRFMKLSLLLIVIVGVSASVFMAAPKPEIMGISLGMSQADARLRLESIGTLERDARKRQEVWAVKDERISHLLVGYDAEFRVRYVTALARTGGPRISYEEVGDLKTAQRAENQGNYKLTWQVGQRVGRFGYEMIAHGHDAKYLDSYSLKKIADEEGEID
jgi:hypothetical protein